MDSPSYCAAEQGWETPNWQMPASPGLTFQMPPAAMGPSYDQAKNSNWYSEQPSFREPRHHNARNGARWPGSKNRHQNKGGSDGRRSVTSSPAQWPQQPPMSPVPAPPMSPQAGYQEMPQEGHQGPVTVKLEGLPVSLCRPMLLEAILDQAGLTDAVMTCVLGQDQESGKALIQLTNRIAAQMCMDHFSGCCWDKTGAPVLASILDGQNSQAPPQAAVNINNQGPVRQDPQGRDRALGGGKGSRKTRTKSLNMEPPFASAMSPHMSPHMSPMSPHLVPAVPLNLVAVPAWSPLGHYAPNDLMVVPPAYTESPDESSTVAGGSSGRASYDTNGSLGDNTSDSFLACDTDDGF